MAQYIELNQKKITRLKREAQQFQDDIVCAVGTDFMQKIAEAENRMIFDILNGLESEPTADVVPKSEVDLYRQQVDELEDELASTYDKLEDAKAEKDALIKNYAECMKDYAKEIFEEIESKKMFLKDCVGNMGVVVLFKDISELKKKYTEEKK